MSKKSPSLGEKHYTATIFILTEEQPSRLLLVHHKKINKWLPPGGHQESNENPLEAIIRECKEETGIDITGYLPTIQPLDPRATSLPLPKYILEEKIDPHGGHPAHFHLDMIYVVNVPYQEIAKRGGEVNEVRWFSVEEIESIETFENVRVLAKRIAQST